MGGGAGTRPPLARRLAGLRPRRRRARRSPERHRVPLATPGRAVSVAGPFRRQTAATAGQDYRETPVDRGKELAPAARGRRRCAGKTRLEGALSTPTAPEGVAGRLAAGGLSSPGPALANGRLRRA